MTITDNRLKENRPNPRRLEVDPRIHAPNADRVATGKDILPRKVDGRTSFVKRIRTYYDLIISDLGGIDNPQLSTTEKAVAKQCAALMSVADEMLMNKANGEYLEGEAWDTKIFSEITKSFTHLARQIGYQRRSKPAGEMNLESVISDIKSQTG